MFNKRRKLAFMLGTLAMTATPMFATTTAPLDFSTITSDIVTDIGTAGGAALVILAAMWTLRVMTRAFKAVAK